MFAINIPNIIPSTFSSALISRLKKSFRSSIISIILKTRRFEMEPNGSWYGYRIKLWNKNKFQFDQKKQINKLLNHCIIFYLLAKSYKIKKWDTTLRLRRLFRDFQFIVFESWNKASKGKQLCFSFLNFLSQNTTRNDSKFFSYHTHPSIFYLLFNNLHFYRLSSFHSLSFTWCPQSFALSLSFIDIDQWKNATYQMKRSVDTIVN